MQAIKGKTSLHLLIDHRRSRAEYWVGTRGRVATSCAAPTKSRTNDCAIYQASRCRARGRRLLSS
jgi:hypothetical protein